MIADDFKDINARMKQPNAKPVKVVLSGVAQGRWSSPGPALQQIPRGPFPKRAWAGHPGWLEYALPVGPFAVRHLEAMQDRYDSVGARDPYTWSVDDARLFYRYRELSESVQRGYRIQRRRAREGEPGWNGK